MPADRSTLAVRLFGYETDGGADSELASNPLYFSFATGQAGKELDERFQYWKTNKRPFTREELVGARAVKISSLGTAYHLTLNDDGTLEERTLMDPKDSWPGTWSIEGGALSITVGSHTLLVLGAKDGLHSGLESTDGEPKYQVYFRLIIIR